MLLVSQQYRITIHPIQSNPIQSIRHLALSVLNLSIDLNCLNCPVSPVSPVLRCYLQFRWHYLMIHVPQLICCPLPCNPTPTQGLVKEWLLPEACLPLPPLLAPAHCLSSVRKCLAAYFCRLQVIPQQASSRAR